MSKMKGQFTIPSEAGFIAETKELIEKWGADAIRDSDGTKLTGDMKKMDTRIYSTYFVAREHNEHAQRHMDECQQMYLVSRHNLATADQLTIRFLEGYFVEQVTPDYRHDPKKWWQVIDRTTGTIVGQHDWSYHEKDHTVVVSAAQPYHEYTVTFLAYMIWDPTQMYNHITNNWKDKPHSIPFDVRGAVSEPFMLACLEKWLDENADVDVVRFTTFFYHFMLLFNDEAKEKYVDWFGYGASVSVKALEAFEKEYGYALTPEDLVNNGYYDTPFCVPRPPQRDYVDFISRFVAQKAKALVDLVHKAGKDAMMFLGDNWIGTEPYGKYFSQIGLDAVVGSVGNGTTLRMISEIPHVKYTEGRFLPYFFPDTFYEGNDPCIEARKVWIDARRAILRKPIDRIGYGGYLSLAYAFPKFVDYIEQVADEFRLIHKQIKGHQPYCGLKVAVLNSWGSLRSWQTHMVAHALPYKQTYTYLGVLESLSGMSVDVSFISFEDVKRGGIDRDIDVIINAGDAYTAFSGGEEWADAELVAAFREWIYAGGGFIGIGEPSAYHHGGRFFQLADALGVDKELGFSLSTRKYFSKALDSHFISEDVADALDFGEGMKNIYALGRQTEIVEFSDGEVHVAANRYGKGRAVYIAGLPYDARNARLLMRSAFYAAGKEDRMKIWFSDNPECEVHAYPGAGKYAVINNSGVEQLTAVYDGNGDKSEICLGAYELRWERI